MGWNEEMERVLKQTQREAESAPRCVDGPVASDWDHRIIDAVSIAMDGSVGEDDDVQRLRKLIEMGVDNSTKERIDVACEIAVAFIRWSQDLKKDRNGR